MEYTVTFKIEGKSKRWLRMFVVSIIYQVLRWVGKPSDMMAQAIWTYK